MATPPQNSHRSSRRSPLVNTRRLAAAAAVPAAALLAAPGTAAAGFYRIAYWSYNNAPNHGCLPPGYLVNGNNRTPYSEGASASAYDNCGGNSSKGWLSTRLIENYNGATLAHNYGLGRVYFAPKKLYNQLQVHDLCSHLGYHHSHFVTCYSSRSTG
jgi:hypothetical protein